MAPNAPRNYGPVKSQFVSVEQSRAGYRPGPPAGELKGAALDAALKTAGLPLTGNAAEKRAALADYEAEQVVPLDTSGTAPANNPEGGSSVSQSEEG